MLTPLVYLWGQNQDIGVVLFLVGVFGFFTLGIWAWAPVWLPELYPTRMRATAVAFVFNAPRFISCVGPLVAGALIVALGGYGWAATYVGQYVTPYAARSNVHGILHSAPIVFWNVDKD